MTREPDYLNSYIIQEAMSQQSDLFLLFYHDLKYNLGRALVKLAHFLGVQLTEEILQCTLDQKEGHYHRSSQNQDAFKNAKADVPNFSMEREALREKVQECMQSKRCVTSGCGFLFIKQ